LTTAENTRGHWKEYNDPAITLVQVRGTTPVPFIKENLPEAKVLLLDNYPDVIRAIGGLYVGPHGYPQERELGSRENTGECVLLLPGCCQGQLHPARLA
jgi:hypothetical protein